ncbi:MAG: DUF2079 domain-containing protein [Chitinophagaceae bacterium]|nr:DUF2079 domain-containing protein [Oligoflexus sp.]
MGTIAKNKVWLGLLLIVLSIPFLALGYVRSESGLVHAFDTGLYLQLLDNLVHGRGWTSSVANQPFFLAYHFQPILALLIPVYLMLPTAFALLLASWVCICIAVWIVIYGMPRLSLGSPYSAAAMGLALFLHPVVTGRMFYSFVPEVMALPALCFLAVMLAKHKLLLWEKVAIVLSLLFLCCTKETLWLTSAWCALLFALRFRKDLAFSLSSHAMLFGALALVFIGGFTYLWFFWMPAWSAHEPTGALGKIFSESNLTSLLSLFLLTPIFLLGDIWVAAGALPAVIVMLAAGDAHGLTNHDLIAALPFLAVAGVSGLDSLKTRSAHPTAYSYGILLTLLIPTATTFMHGSGFIYQAMVASERADLGLRAETEKIKKGLTDDDFILTDGSLQPFFAEYPKVKVILGYQGHPTQVKAEDLTKVTHVITANDLEDLVECQDIKPAPGETSTFDYVGFYRYCDWLQDSEVEKKVIIPTRLIDIKIVQP